MEGVIGEPVNRIVLDAYAARSCPVKTHHTFDPTLPRPESPLDESLRESFQGGFDFRDEVLNRLAASPGAVDLRTEPGDEAPWAEREATTLRALGEGVPIIIGGVLPLDLEGHRSGRPDALILGPEHAPGAPGYWPLKIKPYRVRERQNGPSAMRTSTLADPCSVVDLPRARFRTFREGALLELAHHWALLEACGFSSSEPWVGLVGDDREEGEEPTITWVDLTHKFIRTYSNTAGYKLRSPMERYDHEFRFRVHVATQALARTGVNDPTPPVRPIRVKECEWCAWWQVCRPLIDDDDLSLRISKAPLDVRELQTLLGLGIRTVAELALADVDSLLPEYLPLTRHRDRAEQRLRQAARRARMLAGGVDLEQVTDEQIGVPRAGYELDLDIETADDGSVYLWGVLVVDGEDQHYVHFSRFEHLDEQSEEAVAIEFARWLLQQVKVHPDLRVYHYSDYETVHLRRLADRSADPALAEVVALLREHFVDLFGYVRDNFVGVDGLGLKAVAHKGAGFSWRDSEPGGLASQSWFNQAVDAPTADERDAARNRVLAYNEDDVRATYEVREWMGRLDAKRR